MVERRKVNEVMHEQDFDASNRVKRGSGARIGQIRGADLTLMGDIVVFGRDDRRVGGGAGGGTFGAGAVVGRIQGRPARPWSFSTIGSSTWKPAR